MKQHSFDLQIIICYQWCEAVVKIQKYKVSMFNSDSRSLTGLLEMWPDVTFFPSVMIRPYVGNILNENVPQTKLMLIIDNADDCCQKCMDGEPLLHIYRPRSAKVCTANSSALHI